MKRILIGILGVGLSTALADAQNCTRLPCEADYIWPETASEYVDPVNVLALSPEVQRLARNEIFARHGRTFASADLQAFFGARQWYRPVPGEPRLSDVEAANVRLIHAIETGPDTSGQAFSDVISRDVDGYTAIRDLTLEYMEGFGREDEMSSNRILASGANVRLEDGQGRPVAVLNLRDERLGGEMDDMLITAFAVEWDESLLVVLTSYMQAEPEWLADDLLTETNARIVAQEADQHGGEAVTRYTVNGQGAPDWGWGDFFDDDCFANDPERFAWSHFQHGDVNYPIPALSGEFWVTEDGIILRADYYICSPHHEASTDYYSGYHIRYELTEFERQPVPDSLFEPPLQDVDDWVAPG